MGHVPERSCQAKRLGIPPALSGAADDVTADADPQYRTCDQCGAADGLYVPPHARRPDFVWGVDGRTVEPLGSGLAVCTHCKARVSYGVPLSMS
jgi:hypothetical protein